MESERHVLAMMLLISSLRPWLRRRHEQTGEGGYVGGDMFLYFSPEQVKNRHVRGPDVMIVLGVEPGERKHWVTWHEGKGPDVVIEMLSDTTRKTDKTIKPRVYRDEVGVREYYWFDPFRPEDFAGFAFSSAITEAFSDDGRASPGPAIDGQDGSGSGDAARDLEPDLHPEADGRITSQVLGLRLGPWQGRYMGVDAVWLRWYTLDGELLLPEDAERAEEEARLRASETRRADEQARRADEQARRADALARRADEQAQRADEQARRADALAARLREQGIDPDETR